MTLMLEAPAIMRRSPETQRAQQILRGYVPKSLLGKAVVESFKYLPRELAEDILEKLQSSLVAESSLKVKVARNWGLYKQGLIDRRDVRIEDYGEVGRKVVTTVGAGYIVDALQNIVEAENQKFHGIGTGVTAEAVGDSALVTELTTEYNPNSTRATGTTVEGASGNIFRTVATNTLDSGTPAVIEHGVFSASSAGVLFDRTKFSAAINLVGANADALQSAYEWTLNTGG